MIKRKTFVVIFLTAFLLFIFTAGFYAGNQISKMKTDETEYCRVDTIAVVNLDEGIMDEGRKINYGLELGELPDVNFVYAGLEEARIGFQDNRYAAYILIPSGFSEAVISINLNPMKAPIEYYINPRLKEALSMQVFTEVVMYIQTVNDNMSYLYIDAVLEEFHQAQKDAGIIMEHDEQDMDSINAISAGELLAPLDFSEITRLDHVIAPISLEEEYKEMDRLLDDINGTYDAGYTKAQEEFQSIQANRETVSKAVTAFIDTMADIHIGEDENGNPVYEEGVQQLNQLVEKAKNDSAGARQNIKDLIKWTPKAGETEDPTREKSLYEVIENKEKEIAVSNEEIEKQLNIIREAVGLPEFERMIADKTTIETETETEGETETETESDIETETETETTRAVMLTAPAAAPALTSAETDKIKEALKKIKQKLPKEDLLATVDGSIAKVVKATEDMQDFPVDEAVKIVDEQITAKLKDEVKKEQEKLAEENRKTQAQVNDYSRQLEEYDAFSHLDTAKIEELSGLLENGVSDVQSDVNETGREYLAYTNKVYDNAQENTENLRQDIHETYEETGSNILQMVESTKTARSNLNRQNKEMLEAFTERLPYTKKGSIAAREVYDFVVSPIEVKGVYKTEEFGVKDKAEVTMNRILLLVIIIEGILFAAGVVFYNIHHRTNFETEERPAIKSQ